MVIVRSDILPVQYPRLYHVTTYILDFSSYFYTQRPSMFPQTGSPLTIPLGRGLVIRLRTQRISAGNNDDGSGQWPGRRCAEKWTLRSFDVWTKKSTKNDWELYSQNCAGRQQSVLSWPPIYFVVLIIAARLLCRQSRLPVTRLSF